jgi:D-alanine transaminase
MDASGLHQKDALLYMQVTRGVAPRQHSYPGNIRPTTMMYAWPKTLPDINEAHASVVTAIDFRWSRCDIKSTSLLGNVMANQSAMEEQCYETLFVRDGIITEASHCNVFFVKDDQVYTHPTGPHILDGITRQVVLELCSNLGLEVRLQGIPAKSLAVMDEAFLTGTSTQVLAIKKMDGHVYFDHQPGPITRRLQKAFLELKLKT